ncbi:MAG TPA: Ig-like domain-containing protein [Gemmatimonadaceae bacterium]|jgi:hypothetical protein
MPHLPGARALSRALVSRLVLHVTVLAAITACSGDRLAAPSRGRLAIRSGNAQRGAPGQPLEQPIIVVVRDAMGAPVAGVRVSWTADDGGSISPSQSRTDGDGTASAMWTLGPGLAIHRGRALADGYDMVQFTASTPRDDELPFDVVQPLVLSTYEGLGQTVHPDFVATGAEWTHSADYLFITPYPNGNATFENPSIYDSPDLLRWTPPTGVSNPIAPPTTGYNSDPDAVFVPERDELWLYFRQVTSENVIRLTKSSDGVHWSTPMVAAHAPNHEIISPTVVRRTATDWLMWSVNGNVGCTGSSTTVELRRSPDGMNWSAPTTVSLSQPGLYPWHIDVEWIPSRNEFWALYNAKTPASCTTGAVYLATSADGVQWTTYPSPVLVHGAIREFQDVVYRSTFAYDETSDAVTIWYSGARFEAGNYIWRSAVQRRLRTDLFATVAAPPSRTAATAPTRAVPALVDFP